MIEVLGAIKTGITIFQAAKAGYDAYSWMVGTSIGHKIDNISNKVSRIDESIMFLHEQELYQKNKSGLFLREKKSILIPEKREVDAFMKVHKGSYGDKSIIFSDSVELPRGFLPEFNMSPDNFLAHKTPVGLGYPPDSVLMDDTLVPVQFLQNNIPMIGFIKKGYVECIFGIKFEAAKIKFRTDNLRIDPYKNNKISRLSMCYCGSGMRFKHCHGSLVSEH